MTHRFTVALLGLLAGATGLTALGTASDARAFCGFYVSGADTKLTNDATQVVLMREGTRTVLSMQNSYHGPPQDFAMVVPVPVVLQKENVKTLSKDVFDHIDQLTAPRLVEYWEQDPCPKIGALGDIRRRGIGVGTGGAAAGVAIQTKKEEVRVEAQFAVGEYDIVILSATDATALDAWLHQNGYKIPAGAEPYLRPYVQMGMKFFVAKVDVSKVHFEHVGNEAVLSPLRFHYDSESFNLPIRLGLINSAGDQDLVVTILARNQRYEVANYDNVAIPTNIDVSDATRREFGAFYSTLFDQTLAKHPRAVVTEYSWSSGSCDPCPTPPLGPGDLETLGLDALSASAAPVPGGGAPVAASRHSTMSSGGFVVTRLHTRYSKDILGDDLFFREAPPIVGGREFMQGEKKLEQGARADSQNNFQARYIIRHPWTGPITCRDPQRAMWGGPPGGRAPVAHAASKLGFVPRASAVTLGSFIKGAAPPETFLSTGGATPLLSFPATPPPSAPVEAGAIEGGIDLDVGPAPAVDAATPTLPPTAPPQGGCAGCTVGTGDASGATAIAALFALGLTRVRRRRA